MKFSKFVDRFSFNPDLRGCVGIERERFLVFDGKPVPRAVDFLDAAGNSAWTYELSACQVEDRTRPLRSYGEIRENLLENDRVGKHIAEGLGLDLSFREAEEEDMPLCVYPDPRYLKIVSRLPRSRLLSACRVTGTHIHLGAGSLNEALAIYGALRDELDVFLVMGDHSSGERIRLYKEVAERWAPPSYENAASFFEIAVAEGFAGNLRNCWHFVRITRHGTVECRAFGATQDADEVLEWVAKVREAAFRTL